MRTHRRGFATYTAIVLMILVATTLTAVGMMFANDARRTRSHTAESQLRQLLTAGAVAATKQFDHAQPTTRPIDVSLPAELTSDGAKLTFTLARGDSDDRITAVIHAEQAKRSMEQTVRFERHDGKWQASSATLEAIP